jgi:polyketide cyclase/dehydrase/lipid transport protein
MFNLGSLLNLFSTEPVIEKASIVVECSAVEVFKYIGDNFFQNYPKWSPEVRELKQITPSPVKTGTIAQQVRIDAGHRYEGNFKITIYERNSRLGFMGISDPFRCIYDLQEINSGKSTKLTFTFELLKLTLVMRPFEILIRRTIKDGVKCTVKNIKQLMETADSMAFQPKNH